MKHKREVVRYYSNCCGAFMYDYPDSDFCPQCKEHAGAITEKEYFAEGEVILPLHRGIKTKEDA